MSYNKIIFFLGMFSCFCALAVEAKMSDYPDEFSEIVGHRETPHDDDESSDDEPLPTQAWLDQAKSETDADAQRIGDSLLELPFETQSLYHEFLNTPEPHALQVIIMLTEEDLENGFDSLLRDIIVPRHEGELLEAKRAFHILVLQWLENNS